MSIMYRIVTVVVLSISLLLSGCGPEGDSSGSSNQASSGNSDSSSGNSQNTVDTDGDGIGDNSDPDIDGDGVSNESDAFPLDSNEALDTDNDGIGNNSDPDIDGDGVSNENDAFPLDDNETLDTDNDGIGNNSDPDIDNDGVPNNSDALPLDDSESVDTDGDGIGNNSDPDIDGDGVSNENDAFPLDGNETLDTDNDGIGNNSDPDIDNDGVPNNSDALPLDDSESVDTDGDGIGNNSDPDIDGDGVANQYDSFPLDSAEALDTDRDGIGNNSDPDIDGDGVANESDAFPTDGSATTDTDGDGVSDRDDAFPQDAAETLDTDKDGIGDNADTDKDGDGVVNENDAFPLQPGEWSDTDGDGVGDNSDFAINDASCKTDRNGNDLCDQVESSIKSISLASLNGANGLVLKGIDSLDYSGRSVSSAGDVNGDGFDDILIGASGRDAGATNSGETYLIFGKQPGWADSLDLAALESGNGVLLKGIDGFDASGISVSSAGDVNDDGLDDFLISATGADANGLSSAGEVYLIFGKATGWPNSMDLSSLDGVNGLTIRGVSREDFTGRSISNAGDVNGDGFDDILIGAQNAHGDSFEVGATYLIFGKGSNWTASIDLSSLDGRSGVLFQGKNSADRSGASVSAAGDVNGDGFDDILIGADYADGNTIFDSGETYLVFGKAENWSAKMDLSALDGNNGVVLSGGNISDRIGVSVSAGGDVNGDGFDDILIGAPLKDSEEVDSGSVYLIFGKPSGWLANINLATISGMGYVEFIGAYQNHRLGISVSSAGDVNGDGIDDILIGYIIGAGGAGLIFGKTSEWSTSLKLATLDGVNGLLLEGIDSEDFSGSSVSNAGDVNGDGFDDILIGAPYADPNGLSSAGETYLIFGAPTN